MKNVFSLLDLFPNKKLLNNILIIDDEHLTPDDVKKLTKSISTIYLAFSKNFLFERFLIKLRFYKNVKIFLTNSIPILNYEIICSSIYNDKIKLFLSSVKFIKYFYYMNDFPLNEEILEFSHINNNLYKRNSDVLVSNKIINNLTKKNLLNIDTPTNIDNFKVIKLKNIASTNNDFLFNACFNKKVDGLLNILCNITSINDYNVFINIKNIILKKYKFSKFIILLNGISNDVLNNNDLLDIKYDLLIFNTYKSNDICNKIFKNLVIGIYVYNMCDISENVIDEIIINEN